MSPTENELRAFLREGEGEVPDAVSAISKAIRVREVRRKRITTGLTSLAAAVVVIGGSVLLVNLGRSDEDAGSGTAAEAGSSSGATAGTRAGGSARHENSSYRGPNSADSAPKPGLKAGGDGSTFGAEMARPGLPMCAATPTHYAATARGSAAATGAVWKSTPDAMRLCVYVGSRQPVSRVVYGDDARRIAAAVEGASSTTSPGQSCTSAESRQAAGTVEIYSYDAAKRLLKAVVIDVPGCGAARATNGTATRYVTDLPKRLDAALSVARARASGHR